LRECSGWNPSLKLTHNGATDFNTGDAIRMALDIGAAPVGNRSGCHAVAWERNAPEFGDLAVGDQFQKHSYPWGIYINAEGERFVDEGADFQNYTYAKYGRVILNQPGQFAWQIFDAKVKGQLRDEYRIKQVTKVTANTLEELVKKLDDVNAEVALKEIKAYNAAVKTDIPFNPTSRTAAAPKAWPSTNPTGPTPSTPRPSRPTPSPAASLSLSELVGGIFYFNYPGGTGLTNGAVFGKIAGASAAKQAAKH